jgi:hypothetical protein
MHETKTPTRASIKVSPQTHDDLFAYAGALQARLGRSVTVGEAVDLMLQEFADAGHTLPQLTTDALNAVTKQGRGRPPIMYTESR